MLREFISIIIIVLLAEAHCSDCTDAPCRPGSQCPTWLVPSNKENGSCVCGSSKQVKCDQETRRASLAIGTCTTYNESSNTTVIAVCPYLKIEKELLGYLQLPCDVTELDSFMCGSFNRTGQLCSQCMPGLGPAVLSNSPQCIECLDSRYGWLVFIALGFLGPTLLCILVIVFRVNTLSASMNMFLFTCHLISTYTNLHKFNSLNFHGFGESITRTLFSFYGLWNLDFLHYSLPRYCISENLNFLDVQALEYVEAFCPLVVLVALFICIELHDNGFRPIVVIWRPFLKCCIRFRRSWELRGSIINAFASFLLLSYAKFFNVSLSLLYRVQVTNTHGVSQGYVPYFDASTPYLSNNHKPKFILAIIMLIVFNLLPLLFLLLYPLKIVQRCLGRLPLRCVSFLNTFADAFQGCYKNGTGGTADCRYFAGLYLVFRVVLFSQLYLPFYYTMPFLILTCIIIIFLFASIRPYKRTCFNHLDAWAFILLVTFYMYLWFASYIIHLPYTTLYICFYTPFLYITLYFILKVLPRLRCIKLFIGGKVRRHRGRQETEQSGGGSEEDELPHRLEHPSEYSPLLPQASNPLPQETQEEATAATAANRLTSRSIHYGATI